MKLRTKRRLVNLASVTLVAASVTLVAWAWKLGTELPVAPKRRASVASTPLQTHEATLAATLPTDVWTRQLRQPLYDPPPPSPPAVVAEAPRPIPIKVVGTVIEPGNNQAFVRQASGAVELKRVGDQVTTDPADGSIAEITSSDLVIRRRDGDHRLAVETP